MRHIKSYQIFESILSKEMKDTLDDMSIEMKDEGFKVKIDQQGRNKIIILINKQKIDISKPVPEFYISEISECIIRMIDYMQALGYRHFIFPGIYKSCHFVKSNNINLIEGHLLKSVEIRFKK